MYIQFYWLKIDYILNINEIKLHKIVVNLVLILSKNTLKIDLNLKKQFF